MRIYLAAKFEDQQQISRIGGRLKGDFGYQCTSRWLTERQNVAYGKGMSLIHIAERDLDDIDQADAVVVFARTFGADSGTVGRHVETGYAIAKRKPIVFVGRPAHTFRTLPGMAYVPWPDTLGDSRIRRLATQIDSAIDRAMESLTKSPK